MMQPDNNTKAEVIRSLLRAGESRSAEMSNANETELHRKLDLGSLYEQVEKDNLVLKSNKFCWNAGDNQYICTLCDISIPASKNEVTLKKGLLLHLTGKKHKRHCIPLIKNGNQNNSVSRPNKKSIPIETNEVDKETLLQGHLNSGTHITNTFTDFIETPSVKPQKKKCKKVINIHENELTDKPPKVTKLTDVFKKWSLDKDSVPWQLPSGSDDVAAETAKQCTHSLATSSVLDSSKTSLGLPNESTHIEYSYGRMSRNEKQLKNKIKWKVLDDSFLNFESINVEDNLSKRIVMEPDNYFTRATLFKAAKSEPTEMINANKSKLRRKLDLGFLYEQVEKCDPVLKTNKCFFKTNGNKSYLCIPCDIHIDATTKLDKLTQNLLGHLGTKKHKTRCILFLKNGSKSTNRRSKYKKPKYKKPIIIDTCVNETKTDFDRFFDSFNKFDPVVQTSKKYLRKKKGSESYECTLCRKIITNPLQVNESKYILWLHLNENSHREKLPNFVEIQDRFLTCIQRVSKNIPIDFVDDVKYFAFGPVFNFVRCTVCEVAVHRNPMRLENHLKREAHRMRKNALLRNKMSSNSSLDFQTHVAFRRLSDQIDRQFRADLQYIRVGKIPGYVVCVVCVEVIIATKHFLQSHLNSGNHITNTLADFIKTPRVKVPIEPLKKECRKVIHIDEVVFTDKIQKAKKLSVALKKWVLDDDCEDDDFEDNEFEDDDSADD